MLTLSTVLRTYLPSGEWTPCGWDEHPVIKICACAILRRASTMAKPATKTARALAKANKMADSCASNFDVNSVAFQRGYSTENHVCTPQAQSQQCRYSSPHSGWTACKLQYVVGSAVMSVLLLLHTLTMDKGRNFRRNPHSTRFFVLTTRHFGPNRAFFSCYKTEPCTTYA